MRHRHSFNGTGQRSKGFTLIEILVAVLVLSIGLLGLAALQTASLRANHSAHYRSQATFLSYEIIDELRADRGANVSAWSEKVGDTLPEGTGSATVTSDVATVVVQWNDTRAGGEGTQQFSVQTQL